MRTLSRSPFRTVLLASLFALFTVAAVHPQAPAATQAVPASTQEFLATLSGDQTDAPAADVLPTPKFLSTVCTDDSQCPTGQKCCYPCGIDGCDFVCMQVVRNRCPFFP
ncbi:MAG TPA: WAP domain-containing protein [Thermoanaerobaculia bacterium]